MRGQCRKADRGGENKNGAAASIAYLLRIIVGVTNEEAGEQQASGRGKQY
jgi:hypothetical protein